jgi:hypothetical protein
MRGDGGRRVVRTFVVSGSGRSVSGSGEGTSTGASGGSKARGSVRERVYGLASNLEERRREIW